MYSNWAKIERDLEYINSTWKYQTDGNNIIFGKDAVGRKDRCGLIKLLDTNSVSNDNPYRGRDIFANISNINKSTVSKEVLIAHNVATQEMVAELYSIANNFVVTENINGQKKHL